MGYRRVSTAEQNLARQLEAIGPIARVFTDKVSGKKGTPRLGLEECISYLRKGDELRVSSMDRLTRSLIDLRQLVTRILEKGASVHFIQELAIYRPEAVEPRDDLMLNFPGSFAEFKRSLIREGQSDRIALAKTAGCYKRRAKKRTLEQVKEARGKIAAGVPKAKITRELEVNRSTFYQALEDPA